jgi:sortase A
MRPDSPQPVNPTPSHDPTAGQSSLQPHVTTQVAEQRIEQQNAAANVLRQRIDSLYGGEAVAATSAPVQTPTQTPQTTQPVQQALQAENPYHRTHSAHPLPEQDQWKAYHSAWQQYYQQYYEQYYTRQQAQEKQSYFTKTIEETKPEQKLDPKLEPEILNRDEALYDLRQKLVGKVQASASKVRKSRHFVPIAAALAVVLIFTFVQYNRIFIANVQAYVSPGSVDPQNIVIDPGADVNVGPEPKLIIPKINVDVPAIYGIGPDHDSQMAAMNKGVAHFAIPGANSHPGQIGNTVLAGHSSNDLFDQGDHKFIFVQLEKLVPGDTIYTHYEGKRYTYVVTKTEVVKPTEVSKLIYPTDKPVLTLITCTPIGTALNRLLVTAEQVSPDPSASAAAPAQDTNQSADMPGNSPSLLERMFGAR